MDKMDPAIVFGLQHELDDFAITIRKSHASENYHNRDIMVLRQFINLTKLRVS